MKSVAIIGGGFCGTLTAVNFAIGPLLKGTRWETTAVPELRSQAYQLAKALITHDQRHEPDWVQETPENLVEYYI